MERRYITNDRAQVEIRAEGEDGPRRIAGHAAVTGVTTEIFPGFFERIEPGAFRKAIGRDDVRALWNHDANIVLGRNRSKTLRLEEDDEGLAYSIDPPDTQLVREMVLSPIERGDVTGSSFGFIVDKADEEPVEGGILRSVRSLELFDVSPVTFPAYPDASVALRGVLESRSGTRVAELLRNVLGHDLTEAALRAFLAGTPFATNVDPQAPERTGSTAWAAPLLRRRLELDEQDARS